MPLCTRPGGFTRLVWENVSDSLAGTVVNFDYRVKIDPAVIAINSVVSSPAQAYVNTNPNNVPDIDPVTGAITGDFTQSAGPASSSTEMIPFEIVKSEPSEEDELLRGVHDHQTVYTLTVNNNFINPSTNFSIVDYLPAGLEFLGCGGVDNSAPGTEEYPTSGRIDGAGNAPTLANVCPTGANAPDVTTVSVDPDGAGPLPLAVYTRVEWSSADLAGALGSADLPAAVPLTTVGTFKIDYVAAIPLRQNVMPSATPFVSTANLDNNTGELTTETVSETAWRNYTVATGSYLGGPASTDDDYEQVIAEDVSIHKRADRSTFEQTDQPVFTLFVESSEYARSTTPITVVDTLPATLDHVSSSSTPAFVTRTPTTPDATTSVVTWVLPAFTERSSTATITLTTSVRTEYRGQAGRPVSSSDEFTNGVTLSTTSDTLTSLPGTPVATTATPVEDESSAGLTAKGPTISKDIALPLPGNGVRAECGPGGNGAGLAWDPDLAGLYRPGDLVCFRLRVQFPSRLDTINPVVEDFLPFGFQYLDARLGVDNTVDPGPVTVTVDGRRVVFALGDIDVGGKLLEGIVAARIVDPNAAQPGDIVGNLMKFRYQNSDPTNPSIFQLREDANAEWGEPVLTLDEVHCVGRWCGEHGSRSCPGERGQRGRLQRRGPQHRQHHRARRVGARSAADAGLLCRRDRHQQRRYLHNREPVTHRLGDRRRHRCERDHEPHLHRHRPRRRHPRHHAHQPCRRA